MSQPDCPRVWDLGRWQTACNFTTRTETTSWVDYGTPEKRQTTLGNATGSDLSLCSHDTRRRQKRHIFHKFVNITQLQAKVVRKFWRFFSFSRVLLRVTAGSWEINCVAIKRTIGSLRNRMKCLYLASMGMAVKKPKKQKTKQAKINKHINYVSNHKTSLRTL